MNTGIWFSVVFAMCRSKSSCDCRFNIGRWNDHIKEDTFNSRKIAGDDIVKELSKQKKSGKVTKL